LACDRQGRPGNLDWGIHDVASESSNWNSRTVQRIPDQKNGKGKLIGGEGLVAVAGAYSNALTADGPAAAQYSSAGCGLHARPKPVCFHTVAAVGLKCALGHGNALLFPLKNLRFDSISEYTASRARNPARPAAEFE
jgi:hypothetical protein